MVSLKVLLDAEIRPRSGLDFGKKHILEPYERVSKKYVIS